MFLTSVGHVNPHTGAVIFHFCKHQTFVLEQLHAFYEKHISPAGQRFPHTSAVYSVEFFKF